MCSEGFLADSSTSTLELALPAIDEGKRSPRRRTRRRPCDTCYSYINKYMSDSTRGTAIPSPTRPPALGGVGRNRYRRQPSLRA
jgi:hypothetical protein